MKREIKRLYDVNNMTDDMGRVNGTLVTCTGDGVKCDDCFSFRDVVGQRAQVLSFWVFVYGIINLQHKINNHKNNMILVHFLR